MLKRCYNHIWNTTVRIPHSKSVCFPCSCRRRSIEYSSKYMLLLELFYHLSVDQKHKYWIWQVLEGHKCYNFTISGWQESCTCIFNLPEVCNPLMILRLYDFFSSPLQHKLHVSWRTIRHCIWVRIFAAVHLDTSLAYGL